MSFVLDSSVSLSWCFDDEFTDVTDALLEALNGSGAVAPSIWPLEVLNGLAMAGRRGRIDAPKHQRLAGFLRDLPVVIDDETASLAWTVTAQLAARFRLTLFDAAYLELAQRRGLPLATLDQELRDAGTALGISLLGK